MTEKQKRPCAEAGCTRPGSIHVGDGDDWLCTTHAHALVNSPENIRAMSEDEDAMKEVDDFMDRGGKLS